MSHLRRLTTAMLVMLLATPLLAQSGTTGQDTTTLNAAGPTSVAPPTVVIDRMPPSDGAPAWMTAMSAIPVKAPRTATVHALDAGPTSENGAMMIVGGAALVVGAIISGKVGTFIMVGGSVVGLIGLWNYAR